MTTANRRIGSAHMWDITGFEDEDALDRPPAPGSPWTRITVEEIVMHERDAWMVWRETMLAGFGPASVN